MKEDSLIEIKEDCNGCGACISFCSHRAISMIKDDEGFHYPHIDEKKCVDCHLCENKCPQKNPCSPCNSSLAAYGLTINNDAILSSSTSGGAFYAICKTFYDQYPSGIVYGCVLVVGDDHTFVAKHIRANSLKECQQFRGSKYIQSIFWPIYYDLETDLKKGYQVMCVGTPCQIAGVSRRFAKQYSDQLLLIDILCHSVPSPLMFNEHIGCLEKKAKKSIVDYSFRPKTKGWGHYEEAYDQNHMIVLKGKRITQRHKELFYAELISRPSCSQCKYAGLKGIADFTIGDFWGIKDIAPKFRNRMGVSLVIVHNNRAARYIPLLKDICDIIPVDPVKSFSFNHILPKPMNINRDLFWGTYRSRGFDVASKHFLDSNIVWVLKGIIRNLIPDQKREKLKRILNVK